MWKFRMDNQVKTECVIVAYHLLYETFHNRDNHEKSFRRKFVRLGFQLPEK